MVMVHGDDKGLVLPPKVASVLAIVIPVPYKDADTRGIFVACSSTVKSLTESGIRAEADFRDNYSPGLKYSHWEMKGVPLRIEIGPKDYANNQVRAVRRDNSTKIDIPMAGLVEQVAGYGIPKGAQVLVNVWTCNWKGPVTLGWENPSEFCPERFIGKTIDVKGPGFELLFALWMCPGYKLGLKVIQNAAWLTCCMGLIGEIPAFR